MGYSSKCKHNNWSAAYWHEKNNHQEWRQECKSCGTVRDADTKQILHPSREKVKIKPYDSKKCLALY
ncbi:MAG: hypothetical protein ABIB79_03840 [archaeon]